MLFLFFKYIFLDIYEYIRRLFKLAQFQNNNKDSKIYRSAKLHNSTIEKYCVIFENTIIIDSHIDSHSYIQRNTRVVNTKIGKFCSIAADVSIGPGLHKTDGISTHPSFYLYNTPLLKKFIKTDSFVPFAITNIGSDVWIGEKSVILDGIKIGNGAIIAAGSIVTKDVEDYAIVGGVPAKHIKYRFEKDEINKLLASEWWEESEEWLMVNQPNIFDKTLFFRR